MVRAAGGVVICDGLVLVVHRPRHGDWSFPKGKAELGEEDADCALREVAEETGYRCELLDELPTARYEVADGPKQVRYWRMRVLDGAFMANEEVDEERWLAPGDAAELLTYEHDRTLLDAL